MHQLDHFVWEAFDLKEEEQVFKNLTGVTPNYGGEHLDRGTHNSLLSIGEGRYLEIIALNLAKAEQFGFPTEAPKNFKSRMMTFGCKCKDLNQLKQLVTQAGLEVSSEFEITREAPTGEQYNWHTIVVGNHDFGHFMPFFTSRLSEHDPSEYLTKGCELRTFSVGHPKHAQLAQLYTKLELDIAVFKATKPVFNVVLETPKGRVALSSES